MSTPHDTDTTFTRGELHRYAQALFNIAKAPVASLEDRLTAARAEVVRLERDLADRGAPQVGDWVYLKPGLSLSGLYKVIKRVTPLDSCHKDNSLYLEGDGTQSGGGWMWPHPWMRLATPAEVEARTGASQIKAGDWVVCLDDSLPNRGKERLTKGTLYKVEVVGYANGYHLEGDPNGSWRGSRFRKATPSEVMIEIERRNGAKVIKVGDWVVALADEAVATHPIIKDRLYRVTKADETFIHLDGQLTSGWYRSRFRKATPQEVTQHLARLKEEAERIKVGDWVTCTDPWSSVLRCGHLYRVTKSCPLGYEVDSLGDVWSPTRFRKATPEEVALHTTVKVKGAGGVEYLAAIQLGWVQFGCAAITNVQLRAAHALFMDAEPTCAHYTSLNGGTLTGGRSFTKVWIGEGEFTWEVLEKLIPLLRD